MKTFNKVVTVIGLLLGFVLLPVIAAIPLEILNTIRDLVFRGETSLTTGGRLLIAAAAVILWVVAVILLWLEFRPSRPATIRVSAVEGGAATVQSHSVERRIEQSLMALPTVQAAQARVEQAKNGVSANLTLDTDADVNVPDVTTKAIQRTRYLLEKEVGAAVSEVNVRVRHVAPRAGRVAAPVAVAAPTAMAAAAAAQPVAPAAPAVRTYTPPVETAPAETVVSAVETPAPGPMPVSMEPPAPAYEPEETDWRAADGELEPPPAEDDGLPGEEAGPPSNV
jgi:uncharacterized alkaline shock family protein YloU